MTKIKFTYDMRAVVTCETTAEVPDDVVAAGKKATAAWLEENESDWDEDQPAVDTEYSETLGGRIEILEANDEVW